MAKKYPEFVEGARDAIPIVNGVQYITPSNTTNSGNLYELYFNNTTEVSSALVATLDPGDIFLLAPGALVSGTTITGETTIIKRNYSNGLWTFQIDTELQSNLGNYFLWNGVTPATTGNVPLELTGGTIWFSGKEGSITGSIIGDPVMLPIPNLFSTIFSLAKEGEFEQSALVPIPLVTSISGNRALTFAGSQELKFFHQGTTSNVGLEEIVGASADGHTDWHVFLVFHVSKSFTLNSPLIYENHRIIGNDNDNRAWGIYGRNDNSGNPEVATYFWSGSLIHNSHPIVIGKTHLLEWWQTGSLSYSKVDDGPVLSISGGTIDQVNGLPLFLGGFAGQFFSGSIFEFIVASSSNRSAEVPSQATNNVRNYLASQYSLTV